MTITGLLLIPLGLLAILLPWRFAIAVFPVMAMMTPAAVVNAGSFGLQPGYFMGLLVIGRTVIELLAGRRGLDGAVLRRMAPLGLFLLAAVLALWAAMMFFEGRVYVIGGTDGFNLNLAQPYHFRRENMTQLAYLVLNLTLAYCLAHQTVRLGLAPAARAWDRGLVAACLFAAAVALWQFASFHVGLVFPDAFFYSNAGYFRADSQKMLDVLRVNGCFEEPSTLAYFFTGFLLFAWRRFQRAPTLLSIVLMFLCLACMVLSTSTTAFAGIALFGLLVVVDVAAGRVGRLTRPIRVSRGQLVALVAILLGIVGGVAFALANWEVIEAVFRTNVLEKGSSSSFDERSGVDLMALQIAVETGGIGMGLGSHKPNSLLMTILSNTGVIGLVAFALFMAGLLWRTRAGPGAAPLLRPFQSFVLGLLVIHSFSNPNLSFIGLWGVVGAVLGLIAAAQAVAVPAHRRPRVSMPSYTRISVPIWRSTDQGALQ